MAPDLVRDLVPATLPPTPAAGAPAAGAAGAASAAAGQGGDTVRQYLREIGSARLLSAEDERVLAVYIRAGRAAAALDARCDLEGPDAVERSRLVAEAETGRRAFDTLVTANLRLVVSVAKRYAGRGVPLSDLIQEGNLGLMRAAERFDERYGCRFATYAIWWIRQAVARTVVDQGRPVRLPPQVTEAIARATQAAAALVQELGRAPSYQEIGEAVGAPAARVREWLSQPLGAAALDATVGETGDATLADILPDPAARDPADEAARALLRREVAAALAVLAPLERRVLRLRFGLDGGMALALDETAKALRLTRERVRQIEHRALRRLRHPTCARGLRGYL